MAKTKFNEEDEVRVPTSTEEKMDEEATGKKGAAEATISTAKKLVKIRTSEEVDCIISGKTYSFSKGKEAQVPSDVAAILCYANKAYRL